MKTDPILEELWKIKDDLAREAGFDAQRFMENLRHWETAHPHSGRAVRNAEELRQCAEEEQSKRAAASALALNESQPRKS